MADRRLRELLRRDQLCEAVRYAAKLGPEALERVADELLKKSAAMRTRDAAIRLGYNASRRLAGEIRQAVEWVDGAVGEARSSTFSRTSFEQAIDHACLWLEDVPSHERWWRHRNPGDELSRRRQREAEKWDDPESRRRAHMERVRRGERPKLAIEGRRWFNRRTGNTYHSATVYYDDQFIGREDYAYGYGAQFVDTGAQVASRWGLPRFGEVNEGPWAWARRIGVELDSPYEDVRRKRDLTPPVDERL